MPYLRSVKSDWEKDISPVFEDSKTFTIQEFYQKLNLDSNSNFSIQVTKTTSTGRVVAAGDTTINAHGTAYGTRTVGMYWGGAGVERMYMDTTRIEGFPMDTSYGSVFTASFRQVIDVN